MHHWCKLKKLYGLPQCWFLSFDIMLQSCKMLTLREARGWSHRTSLYIPLQPLIIIWKSKVFKYMANSYHNMSWGSLSLNFSNTKHSTDCQLRYKIQHPSVPMADWLTEAPTDARPADVQVLYLTWYSIVGPPHPWIPHLQHESMVIWVHGVQNPQISALTVNAFLKKGRERGNMEEDVQHP